MNHLLSAYLDKLTETNQKLNDGFQIFNQIKDVEIGTAPREEVWKMDKVRLFHYTSQDQDQPKLKTPLLISYALINRYYMLDLQPDRSLIRKLMSLGTDIYILDTGYPTRNDRYLSMNDYINTYIDSAIDFIRESHQVNNVNLMGVCQGGTFSIIYSAIHPSKIKNLITLVTPVDFSGNDGLLFKWARDLDVDAIVEAFGGLIPGMFLDTGFQMLKPMLKIRKQNHILRMLDNEAKLTNFLRMEKWITDLPDQAGECYRQFIKDLYQQNKLIKGELQIGEHQVDLKKIDMPVLTIYASEDHLVPPSATKPLNEAIGSKDKQLYEFPGGHIGVFTGSRAQKELSPTIVQWLEARDQPETIQSGSTPKTQSTNKAKESKIIDIQKRPEKELIQETKKAAPSIAPSQLRPEKEKNITDLDFNYLGWANKDQSDDLKKLNGIGPGLEKKLNKIGIYTFAQISKLREEDIEKISNLVSFAVSRINKSDWVSQAKELVSEEAIVN